jgi:hypothetical protein
MSENCYIRKWAALSGHKKSPLNAGSIYFIKLIDFIKRFEPALKTAV